MGSMATALQQASVEKPDCASPPDNPASPSRSEPQVETVESPTSPAVVEVCTETSQTPFQVQTATKVVDSTPLADERPTTASMASLNTLAVWPDGSELDLSLSLEESLRPNERRLLASGPADASVTAQEDRAEPSFEGKPITSPDGLTCLACGQRAPSMEHMSAHFMTAAHTRAVKAYMAQ